MATSSARNRGGAPLRRRNAGTGPDPSARPNHTSQDRTRSPPCVPRSYPNGVRRRTLGEDVEDPSPWRPLLRKDRVQGGVGMKTAGSMGNARPTANQRCKDVDPISMQPTSTGTNLIASCAKHSSRQVKVQLASCAMRWRVHHQCEGVWLFPLVHE